MEGLEEKINTTDHTAILKRISETNDWKNLLTRDWYIEKMQLMGSRFTDTDKPQKSNSLF
jgi:hypothetical protein